MDEGLREAESERDEALRYAPIAIIIKALNSILLSITASLTAVEKLSLIYKSYCHYLAKELLLETLTNFL